MSRSRNFISCPDLQTQIGQLWAEDGSLPARDTEVLQMLLSNANTSGVISSQVNSGNRRLRQVEMVYQQDLLTSDVSADGRINCGEFDADGDISITYDIDPTKGSSIGWSITAEDLERSCNADSFYLARTLARHINTMRRSISEKATIEMIANIGNIALDVINGNAAGTTTWFSTNTALTGGAPDFQGVQDIKMIATYNQLFGGMSPMVIGGPEWYKYAVALNAACCNAEGIDAGLYSSQAGWGFLNSTLFGSYSGDAKRALIVMPGAVQLLKYNEFLAGDNIVSIDSETLVQGVIADPDPRFAGLAYDYYAKYDCTGTTRKWNFQLALAHDTAYLPSDLFQAGDYLEGVNGIAGIETA